MRPKDYESAVGEFLRIHWPRPLFEVRCNFRLRGTLSESDRQIDAGVFNSGSGELLFVVEAKRHSRRIDVGVAGSTVALVSDVGGVPAIMVSTKGFSLAADRLLGAVNIAHLTITLVRAEALQWIPILEKQFAIDPEFKAVSGKLTEALRSGNPAAFDHEAIPYEEWLAVMYTGLSRFPTTTKLALHRIASNHPDGGHRYNAILLLSTENALDAPEWLELLSAETDPEVIELIQETLDFCEA